MLKYPLLFIFILTFAHNAACQKITQTGISHDTSYAKTVEWKSILTSNSFIVTKNKHKIPPAILKRINVDSISQVTRYWFRWKADCFGSEPGIKLNWAATDNRNWIVCYATSGYSTKTHYELLSPDSASCISLSFSGIKHYKFRNFKPAFLGDKMSDTKVIRARY